VRDTRQAGHRVERLFGQLLFTPNRFVQDVDAHRGAGEVVE
jgi:hypothetical protein